MDGAGALHYPFHRHRRHWAVCIPMEVWSVHSTVEGDLCRTLPEPGACLLRGHTHFFLWLHYVHVSLFNSCPWSLPKLSDLFHLLMGIHVSQYFVDCMCCLLQAWLFEDQSSPTFPTRRQANIRAG